SGLGRVLEVENPSGFAERGAEPLEFLRMFAEVVIKQPFELFECRVQRLCEVWAEVVQTSGHSGTVAVVCHHTLPPERRTARLQKYMCVSAWRRAVACSPMRE